MSGCLPAALLPALIRASSVPATVQLLRRHRASAPLQARACTCARARACACACARACALHALVGCRSPSSIHGPCRPRAARGCQSCSAAARCRSSTPPPPRAARRSPFVKPWRRSPYCVRNDYVLHTLRTAHVLSLPRRAHARPKQCTCSSTEDATHRVQCAMDRHTRATRRCSARRAWLSAGSAAPRCAVTY